MANQGTIFRVFCTTDKGTATFPINIDTELTSGRVGVGIESMVLIPAVTTELQQDYWATRSYIQFSSPNFPPFIDVTSNTTLIPPQRFDLIFNRIPLIATPNVGNALQSTRSTYAIDRLYTQDSASFSQMRNNANSLGSGQVSITLLDQHNDAIPDDYLEEISFTLMIYKPK